MRPGRETGNVAPDASLRLKRTRHGDRRLTLDTSRHPVYAKTQVLSILGKATPRGHAEAAAAHPGQQQSLVLCSS